MTVSDDYKRGYAKGYSSGVGKRWPQHRPIIPPHDIMGPIVEAARELRDAIDGQLAMFCDDDPICELLYPHVDAVDEAMESLHRWTTVGAWTTAHDIVAEAEIGGVSQSEDAAAAHSLTQEAGTNDQTSI